eukprot:5110696-Pyramimonas_sp.AAC.1
MKASYGVQNTAAMTLLKEIRSSKEQSKWWFANNEHAYAPLQDAIAKLESVAHDANKPHYAQFLCQDLGVMRSQAVKSGKVGLLDNQFTEFHEELAPLVNEMTLQMTMLLNQCSSRQQTQTQFGK